MSNVFFKPWVGDRYGSMFRKRVLILGEAHYRWDPKIDAYPELTRTLIGNQISGDHTYHFWTRVAGAFLGHKPTWAEKGPFWHSVAFANRIQEYASVGPGVAPTPEMWARSHAAFAELIEELTPQAIIVLGYRQWNHMPLLGRTPGPVMDDPKKMLTWRYPLTNGNSALAYPIRHPSSGFNGAKWYPHIRKAVSLA
jgi:hypothetical protein